MRVLGKYMTKSLKSWVNNYLTNKQLEVICSQLKRIMLHDYKHEKHKESLTNPYPKFNRTWSISLCFNHTKVKLYSDNILKINYLGIYDLNKPLPTVFLDHQRYQIEILFEALTSGKYQISTYGEPQMNEYPLPVRLVKGVIG